ncbi:MAG: acylneuraminate cytidylyltransferase [Rikenellaceae bacterium]
MVVAFIPVRGGSKSIPLKNIQAFCGKPLVCWNIEALERCSAIDSIIVATDSPEIERVVAAESYSKVTLYRRSAENASDGASTESVMLEYISYAGLPSDTTFVLAQATSPLTQTIHFDEAMAMYNTGIYDSLLTCVRNFRFYWREDGTSKNYDYMNRPRRQDFSGELMENGAFYINSVGRILESGNRLSGKIGIYEMPEYTATEIDEPDDWHILESLMRRHILLPSSTAATTDSPKIKLFLSDVDGVMTDGGMYYSEDGSEDLIESKKFNTRDGMGFQLLRESGIKTGIITSENTLVVKKRAEKIKADYLYQGKQEGGKLSTALEICRKEGISLDEVAYIGDDINCFELLSAVGVAACPADAAARIKSIPNIKVLTRKGGEGCVREFAESLLY